MGLEQYRGREHSFIKHELLKGYLEKLLFIMGRGGVQEITYVDCFAGPWGDESETLEGTSIAISLAILEKVKDALTAPPHNISGTKYRAIFIEKNKKTHHKLRQYLATRTSATVECHDLHGDYSELQDPILDCCGNGFAFFFIDPKGWKSVGVSKLSKLLKRPDSEFLVTFMYDFLIRAVRIEDLRAEVCELLGELDDDDVEHLWSLNQEAREEWVVRRYRRELKKMMPGRGLSKPRSYHATILDKDKSRTKYHMVYLTRHPKGIVEFSKLSEKVNILQRRVRHVRKENVSRQTTMFTPSDDEFLDSFAAGIDNVKEYWLRTLTDKPVTYDESHLADVLEETGWLESDLQIAFRELLREGKVENLNAQRRRRTRFVHFDKGERLRRTS